MMHEFQKVGIWKHIYSWPIRYLHDIEKDVKRPEQESSTPTPIICPVHSGLANSICKVEHTLVSVSFS